MIRPMIYKNIVQVNITSKVQTPWALWDLNLILSTVQSQESLILKQTKHKYESYAHFLFRRHTNIHTYRSVTFSGESGPGTGGAFSVRRAYLSASSETKMLPLSVWIAPPPPMDIAVLPMWNSRQRHEKYGIFLHEYTHSFIAGKQGFPIPASLVVAMG